MNSRTKQTPEVPAVEPASQTRARVPDLAARHRSILCLDDFEQAARKHLPRPVFSYIAGGAETNHSFRVNREVFEHYSFVTRVLVDITRRSTGMTLLGRRYEAPFGIAPMGLQALSAYGGDLVLARAAARENIPFVMSGSSLIRMEDVVRVNPQAWFQAYLPASDRDNALLVERVKAAGYKTLVVTLDTAVGANRENNVRAGFNIPLRPTLRLAWEGISHPRWLFGTFLRTLAQHGMPHFENSYAQRGAPILSRNVERDFSDRGRLDWQQLAQVRARWPGHLVVKGVLDARDAMKAVEHGVDAVIVSNHGGRQLDGAVAPLRVLQGIVAACSGVPVMLDSGVRRGTDVLKALALGASFVFVGRPFGFAAAVAGEAGVLKAIEILKQEVSRDIALLGITSPDQLNPGFLVSTLSQFHR